MSDQTARRNAIVIGVGPEDGLGGQLCVRFAERGPHVFIGLSRLEIVHDPGTGDHEGWGRATTRVAPTPAA